MTTLDTVGIAGAAICLSFPLWGAYILRAYLDSRPTRAERWHRNHANVLRRREQINRRGW
jgi:hypothetical protein